MEYFKIFNKTIDEIENNLIYNKDLNSIVKISGLTYRDFNVVFCFLTKMTLKEYIRNRKLTLALNDIFKGETVIQTAFKYGYLSETGFSRAFKEYHKVLPSKLTLTSKVSFQPKLTLNNNEDNLSFVKIRQEILDDFTLYGKYILVSDLVEIHEFWKKEKEKAPELFKNTYYGLVDYLNYKMRYFIALNKPFEDAVKINIKGGLFLSLTFKNSNFKDISKISKDINKIYTINHKSYIKQDIPDIEIYNDDEAKLFFPLLTKL